ncbi:ATPase [candidate division WWE3 bacterium]|uniref:ATPase n=1 Tax=candidate division WWE3 bacterium TaxID=2053526 RepID=A0A955LHI5_UNCKA|nr:ATPase [candidate division WWE3 bacterium]
MHKRVSESQAKQAIFDILHISQSSIPVISKSELATLPDRFPWLLNTRLAAKPDVGIGKRGVQGLLSLNNDWNQTREWLSARWGESIEREGFAPIILDRFIVEEFVEHQPQDEYYLALNSQSDYDQLMFSRAGGVHVQENWDQVHTFQIDLTEGLNPLTLEQFFAEIIPSSIETNKFVQFASQLYSFFVDWNFAEIEINPLVFTNNHFYILDLKSKVDSDAEWENQEQWGHYFSFPPKKHTNELVTRLENRVRDLDENSGASLKLSVINHNGSIWPLVAGGGASIIVADAIASRGLGNEIGFYGEYSGNPDDQLVFEYTDSILQLLLAAQTSRRKVLLILGGIANFTDVAATFGGISTALRGHAEKLKAQNVKVLVRRGGPNYEKGLEQIRQTLNELGLENDVHGPETGLTQPVWKI